MERGIIMGLENKRSVWQESFGGIDENEPGNPILALAQILIAKGFPVEISENAVSADGRILKDHVTILARGEPRAILDQVAGSVEFQALVFALNPRIFRKLDVKGCDWDQPTKLRVYDTFLRNVVPLYKCVIEDSEAGEGWIQERDQLKQLKRKASETIPLTQDDIRSLIVPLVDRVLAQSQRSS